MPRAKKTDTAALTLADLGAQDQDAAAPDVSTETETPAEAAEEEAADAGEQRTIRAKVSFGSFHKRQPVSVSEGQVVTFPAEVAAQLVAAGHADYAD